MKNTIKKLLSKIKLKNPRYFVNLLNGDLITTEYPMNFPKKKDGWRKISKELYQAFYENY